MKVIAKSCVLFHTSVDTSRPANSKERKVCSEILLLYIGPRMQVYKF